MFESLFAGLTIGVLGTLGGVWWIRRRLGSRAAPQARIQIHASVEAIRAVGELVVLKAYTQQISTQSDHMLGQWGERWMRWLISSKKTALIFKYVVDFRYDLRNPAFRIEPFGETGLRMKLPPFRYEIQHKGFSIYDERASALMPVLLPEWIGQVFGGRFTENEKNQLIEGSQRQAESWARQLADEMRVDVQASAETTLRSIAQSMGFDQIEVKFSEDRPTQGEVDVSTIEREASSMVTTRG